MRAAVLTRYGTPDGLVVQNVDAPRPGPRDVVVEVRASSVNPVDTKIRSGAQRAVVRHPLPWILGLDVSGVVVATGARVSRFQIGDEVYASPTHRRPGCYAEQVAIDERQVARKPRNLSHLEAATLPLVTLTALRCLEPRLKDRPGQRVHIQAGTGGVGSIALQLARIFGAEVSTTCSAPHADLARELGAHRVIDYREQAFSDVVNDRDLVLESVGGDDWRRALEASRCGGEVASINAGLGQRGKTYGPYLGSLATALALMGYWLRGAVRGVRVRNVVRVPDGDALCRVTDWVEQGALRPLVGRVFPLEQIADAHRALERGGFTGKIAISM
jgi:NADPH:quinone reductase-like Zn-dependent oxidoreductase